MSFLIFLDTIGQDTHLKKRGVHGRIPFQPTVGVRLTWPMWDQCVGEGCASIGPVLTAMLMLPTASGLPPTRVVDEDTFGVDGAGACKIFQEIDLCTKKSTATSALFAGGVIGFFADLFSEKMPVQAALQWIACALAVLSLTTMASAFHSDKATCVHPSPRPPSRSVLRRIRLPAPFYLCLHLTPPSAGLRVDVDTVAPRHPLPIHPPMASTHHSNHP